MFHDLRLVPAAVGAWGGTVLLLRGPPGASVLVAFVAVLVTVGAWRRWPGLALSGVVLVVVATVLAWRLAQLDSSPIARWAEDRRAVEMEFVLVEDPRPVVGSTSQRWRVGVRAAHLERSVGVSVRHRATVFVAEERVEARVGARYVARVRLAEPRHRGDVATGSVLQVRQVRDPAWWWTLASGLREAITVSTARHDDAASALVPALVTGDESGLDDLTRTDFRRAGLTHLLAVSGANLTIVLAVVLALVRTGGLRRFEGLVGVFVVIGFVLVARPEPSVLRAAVMGVVALAGLRHSHTPAGLRALAVAVIVLVVVDPWLAIHVGFGLSVLATAGIVVLAPPLAERFSRWSPRWFALVLAVPLAAQVACLPLVAIVSHEVSLVSVGANMLVGPAVAPATVCGLAAGLAHLVTPVAAVPFAEIGWACARFVTAVAAWSASATGAAVPWPVAWWWLVPVSVLSAVVFLRWGSRGPVMAVVTLTLVVWVVQPFPRPGIPEGTVLVVCDVGQGDGLVIPVAPGQAVVVDVGEHPAAIDTCLRRLDVTRVPLVVLTHDHLDHTGGWTGLTRGRHIGTVLVGPTGATGVTAPTREVRAGERFAVGAVDLEVLWPRPNARGLSVNDSSVVLRVRTAEATLLLTGDLGADAQRRLEAADVRADVVKVAHHGSADMWPGLWDRAGARLAVVSVGADNRHGHPAPALLEALAERGITLVRTDRTGTFAVVRTGTGFRVVGL